MRITDDQWTLFIRAERLASDLAERERQRRYIRPEYTHLVAIGASNWDYYANDGERIAFVAKPGNSANDGRFSDLNYFRGHMTRGYHGEILTDYGRQLVGEHYATFWTPDVT